MPSAARSFHSLLNLKVYEYGFGARPDRYLGYTSSKNPRKVSIPFTATWFVQPIGRLEGVEIEYLAQEIKLKRIPGVDLSYRRNLPVRVLQSFSGIDSLRLVILSNTGLGDEALVHAKGLKGLKFMVLDRQTTDAGLASLRGLKHIEGLMLHRTKVTDAGLDVLKDFRHLESLDLSGTKITDTGAKTLASLTSLRQLDISDTAITDKGLKRLAGLTRLRSLYVSRRVTDAGVVHLAGMKRLQTLDLSGAPITDAGMVELSKLDNLQELSIGGTLVGNPGLKQVAQMKKLHALDLTYTHITEAGLVALEELPYLDTISFSWDQLSDSQIRALSGLRNLKTVILNGNVMSEPVLNRIRAMAKLSAPRTERVEAAHPKSPTSPESKAPGAWVSSTFSHPKLKNKNRKSHKVVDEAAIPKELAPAVASQESIALDDEEKGPGMVIEVTAGHSGRRRSGTSTLSGLKGIHRAELAHGAKDPDVVPAESRQIDTPKDSAANSLGEIEVDAH